MDRSVCAKKRLFCWIIGLILLLPACAAPAEPSPAPVAAAEATATALPTPDLTAAPMQTVFVAVQTPTPTPTPIPTPTPEPTPTPTPEGLLGGRFDGFSYTGEVITESEYRSEHISIKVYHAFDKTSYKGYIDYHVADIHLQDITLLKTGCAGEDFTRVVTAQVSDMAEKYGAILAVSGDYCSVNNGIVVRNGVVYHQEKPSRNICVIYRDGSMRTFTKDEYTVEELLAQEPWHVFNFGPGLLDENGKARRALYLGVNANKNNPRCVLGYYEPGHYALCLIDGRQLHKSRGLDIADLAKFAENMGFAAAFNLDGGNSAVMVWQGQVYNVPSSPGGRGISDILYLTPEGDSASYPFAPDTPLPSAAVDQ